MSDEPDAPDELLMKRFWKMVDDGAPPHFLLSFVGTQGDDPTPVDRHLTLDLETTSLLYQELTKALFATLTKAMAGALEPDQR